MAIQQVKLSISVVDVDHQPVKGFSVECYWSGTFVKNNPGNGASVFTDTLVANIPADEIHDLKIVVSHPSFFTEETNVHPQGSYWTNPTCVVKPPANPATDELQVKFVLSQLRTAPTDFMTVAEIKKRKRAPVGILLNDPKYDRDDPNYLELFENDSRDWYAPKTISCVQRRILGDPKSTIDWERLKYFTTSVNPRQNGHFRWLEYGRGQHKYLIAMWLPKPYFKRDPGSGSKLDFIVFFSPHTRKRAYELRGGGQTYPYGLNKEGAFQPYAALGVKYMFVNGLNICHELMAAKKKAILVMPMCKYGDWGPFALRDGVGIHRMLKEIAHYLHNEDLLIGKQPSSYQRTKGSHKPIPDVSRVITAGFSQNGVMTELFTGIKAKFPSVFPTDPKIGSEQIPTTFKTRDAKSFQPLWQEIWDLDLEADIEGLEKQLREWQKSQDGRRYRMYHSNATARRWRPRNAESWIKRDKGGNYTWVPDMRGSNTVDPYEGEAEEIHQINDQHSDAWSLVYLAKKYLVSTGGGGFPLFPLDENEVHDKIMLAIAFGHAALSSSLKPL